MGIESAVISNLNGENVKLCPSDGQKGNVVALFREGI